MLAFIDLTDVVAIVIAAAGLTVVALRKPIAAFNIWLGNLIRRSETYDSDDQRLTEVGQAALGLLMAALAIYVLVSRRI